MKRFAVIGGTGINELAGLTPSGRHSIKTPYGATSRPIEEGRIRGCTVYFLQRHGAPGAIPPHKINYRANLWALHSLGVTEVVAINAVGGINPDMPTGALVVPDQIIDYTWGREHSIDDGAGGELLHIDFTRPYDETLRQTLLDLADDNSIRVCAPATHGITQGPRLETAAEIARLEHDGCDVVGMTGMPEAALARELGMAYASICMVVNPAAGKGDQPITLDMMRETLRREAAVVESLLAHLFTASSSG
ncbi:MAG: S-methyl-5'-thioinosine phosphorylase [Proteobacteria bacterium]|nr:S-methyl-5'-thioinosine phosphorylase [Pseudomonadota bacterium]